MRIVVTVRLQILEIFYESSWKMIENGLWLTKILYQLKQYQIRALTNSSKNMNFKICLYHAVEKMRDLSFAKDPQVLATS